MLETSVVNDFREIFLKSLQGWIEDISDVASVQTVATYTEELSNLRAGKTTHISRSTHEALDEELRNIGIEYPSDDYKQIWRAVTGIDLQ